MMMAYYFDVDWSVVAAQKLFDVAVVVVVNV